MEFRFYRLITSEKPIVDRRQVAPPLCVTPLDQLLIDENDEAPLNVTEEVIIISSDDESENLPVNKFQSGRPLCLRNDKSLEAGSSKNLLTDKRKRNRSEVPKSETHNTHSLPVELDDVINLVEDDTDNEIGGEFRNPLPSFSRTPKKLKESSSGNEFPTEYYGALIKSGDSYKAKKIVRSRSQNLSKLSSSKKASLSSQKQSLINNYGQAILKVAEKIYRKPKTRLLKKPLTKAELLKYQKKKQKIGLPLKIGFPLSDDSLSSGDDEFSGTSP